MLRVKLVWIAEAIHRFWCLLAHLVLVVDVLRHLFLHERSIAVQIRPPYFLPY